MIFHPVQHPIIDLFVLSFLALADVVRQRAGLGLALRLLFLACRLWRADRVEYRASQTQVTLFKHPCCLQTAHDDALYDQPAVVGLVGEVVDDGLAVVGVQ